jgi:SSS family solute:Na+ symporter
VAFYLKVRPAGPGWRVVREEAGVSAAEVESNGLEDIPTSLLGWATVCTVIWSALFALGNLLYGRYVAASALSVVCGAGSLVLVGVVRRLWK